jgi:hypothetical protein
MALFKVVVEAYVASKELDQASLSRLAWWVDVLGDREIAAITADDIDAALLKLAERGRLKAGRGMTTAAAASPSRARPSTATSPKRAASSSTPSASSSCRAPSSRRLEA